MSAFKAACIQMNVGPDINENLVNAGRLITEAANAGAEYVQTPENTDYIRATSDLSVQTAKPIDEHTGVQIFSALAKDLGIWLHIGSMKIKVAEDKVANRSFLFNNKGMLKASYDKIHLFDADLPNGEEFRESDFVQPGDKAVVSDMPWANIGMSICFDVRFPYLYRDMAQNGADILAVPAAFAENTGRAHWESLLRARAIETGSFVLAAATVGDHEGGRQTFGQSMIIGPWGQVLEKMEEDKPGFIMRSIDTLDVVKARKALPNLAPNKEYKLLKPKLL